MIGKEFIGGFMNLANTAFSNILNENAADRARAENFKYNEMAADAADKRQRQQFWDLYSIGSQMQQIKNAGLSPSLMYGGTPSPGGSASGAQGAGGGNIMPIRANYSLEGALLAAQIKNLDATAEKTKAETNTINGENARGIAEIQEILSNAGYNKAAEALAEANKDFQELQTFVGWQTADSDIQTAARTAQKLLHDANKAYEEAVQAGLKTKFDRETYDERVKQVGADLALTYAECALKSSQKEYTDTQKNALKEQILQRWVEIGIKYNEMLINGASQRASQRYLEDSIKAINKELGIKETDMWLDFGIDCANTVIKLADLITDLIPQTAAVKKTSMIFSKTK